MCLPRHNGNYNILFLTYNLKDNGFMKIQQD